LIAEDNYINRRVFIMFLKHLGYHADCVENGLECLNLANHGNYDLILSDVDMPAMSGIECARELRRAGILSRIIAVIGSKVESPHEQCLNAGMDGFIPKPFRPEELKHALRETHRLKIEKSQARQ
jgi:CheY-like chemotaxis protein